MKKYLPSARGTAAFPRYESQWFGTAPAEPGLLSTPTMPDSARTGTRLTNERIVVITYIKNKATSHWTVRGAA